MSIDMTAFLREAGALLDSGVETSALVMAIYKCDRDRIETMGRGGVELSGLGGWEPFAEWEDGEGYVHEGSLWLRRDEDGRVRLLYYQHSGPYCRAYAFDEGGIPTVSAELHDDEGYDRDDHTGIQPGIRAVVESWWTP